MNELQEKKEKMANDLDDRLCNHIAQGNTGSLFVIQTYHMKEIHAIRDYMMDFLGDWYLDPRYLNQLFYAAISELNIDLRTLLVVPLPTKVVKSVDKKISLVI